MNNENRHITPIELITSYLANEANGQERELVDQWISSSEQNRQEFEAIKKLWNASESVANKETIDIDAEWDKMEKVISPAKSGMKQLNRILRIAALIVVISSLAFIGIRQSQIITHKAPALKISSVELPDGSTVSLNAKSKISYKRSFGKTDREITLKGEGYFEVIDNNELPFIVRAHEARIEVVGTQFNVKAYKKQPEVKVTVTKGKVQLSEHKQPVKKTILTAGETGTYNRDVQVIGKKPVVNNNDISWKTKVISFNRTPLIEVVDVLRNTYHLDIVLNKALEDCIITVDFNDEKLGHVLNVLKETLDLKYKREGNKLIITGDGCQ